MQVLDVDARVHDGPAMRGAGHDALSVALIDARNRLLQRLAAFEQAGRLALPPQPDADPPLWTLGHAGWYQEAWIARNVQRGRGRHCTAEPTRLASIDPDADGWFDPRQIPPAARWSLPLPPPGVVRAYLADTLEVTLELLAACRDDDDEGLYFFRRALLQEDLAGEALAVLAAGSGVALPGLQGPRALVARDPIWMPATRWAQGSSEPFHLDNEAPVQDVALPECEIDAQPVNWAQFAEFAADGGYDDPRWWPGDAWRWVQDGERRAPRHVAQLGEVVLLERFGGSTRVSAGQPAQHVSWYEAQAWCLWAGRRLPTEVEWEAAAVSLARRGFAFGDVWEWTASRFEPYPGFVPDPDRAWSQAGFGATRVLRGGSFAGSGRLRHPRLRGFAPPARDSGFYGFRSCAA